MVSNLLRSKDFKQVVDHCHEHVAFSKLLIAVAEFTSLDKEVPLLQIKTLLKEALLVLCGTGNEAIGLSRED